MKLSHSFSLLTALVILLPVQSKAAPLFSLGDDWMHKKIEPSPQTLTVEDALFYASKATSANILVDATQLPVGEIKPYARRKRDRYEMFDGTRVSLMAYISNQARLCYERSAPDTFVIWRRPDINKLVSLAIAEQKQWDVGGSPEDAVATVKAIDEFFTRTRGWNAEVQTVAQKAINAQGIDATWKIDDFPAELRTPIRNELARQTLNLRISSNYRRFSMDYWRRARVTLRTGKQNVYDENGGYQGVRENPVVIVSPEDKNGPLIYIFPHWDKQGQFTSKEALKAQAETTAAKAKKQNTAQPIPVALPRAITPPVVPSSGVKLDEEQGLKKRVSFSVKPMPLTEFVAELQKQSGVKLSVDTALSPDLKVMGCTVNTEEQPTGAPSMLLSSAMSSLARLFAAHWEKEDTAYVLRSDGMDELRLGLRQMGYNATYGYMPYTSQELDEFNAQLADEILGYLDINALRSDIGVPFSELPVDVQNHALQSVINVGAGELLVAQQRLDDVLAQDLRFRFSPLPADTPNFFGAFMTASFSTAAVPNASALRVYTADGRHIARIFPALSASPASAWEKQREDYWKGANDFLKKQQGQQEQNP